MKHKKIICGILGAFLGCLLLQCGCSLFNPLRRSEKNIEKWLLDQTPLGSSMAQVEKVIAKNRWTNVGVSEDSGFYHQDRSPPQIVGNKSIRANLGDYLEVFLMANVTAFWAFDENGKLIDIWAWKTIDGP